MHNIYIVKHPKGWYYVVQAATSADAGNAVLALKANATIGLDDLELARVAKVDAGMRGAHVLQTLGRPITDRAAILGKLYNVHGDDLA